jgi:hypothetical protein
MKKHRYFYLCGASKKQTKAMRAALKYPVIAEYPKSEKTLYDAGERIELAA